MLMQLAFFLVLKVVLLYLWIGRKDIEDGISGLRIHQIIEPYVGQFKSKVFLGFCSDEGVKRNKGRVGARNAPNEIRKSLSNLPVHFSNFNIFGGGALPRHEEDEGGGQEPDGDCQRFRPEEP